MTEAKKEKEQRIERLYDLFIALIKKTDTLHAVQENEDVIDKIIPSDIISLLDKLEEVDLPLEQKKEGMNKFFNVVNKSLMNYPHTEPAPDSFLGCCVKNNRELDKRLRMIRSFLIRFNKQPSDNEVKNILKKRLYDIQTYNQYYHIKENVLFPTVEKMWEEYGSLKIMWSYHEDIRKNTKEIIDLLENDTIDLPKFNKLAEHIIFHMRAIAIREERILFPLIERTISIHVLNDLFDESANIGFPYYSPPVTAISNEPNEKLDLITGELSIKQIVNLFGHLPVHVTYINEFDIVLFYSASETSGLEQDDIAVGMNFFELEHFISKEELMKTVDEFRKKSQKSACFWKKIEEEKVLSQLYAIYENDTYKGFIEVDQVISDIECLKGDKVKN